MDVSRFQPQRRTAGKLLPYFLMACFGGFIILLPQTPIPEVYYRWIMGVYLLMWSPLAAYRTRQKRGRYAASALVFLMIPVIWFFVLIHSTLTH